jgi:hypothetical protein
MQPEAHTGWYWESCNIAFNSFIDAPMTTKVIASKDARLPFTGKAALIAAAAGDTKDSNRFKMTLYTGGVFYGHWYYGDVILDLTGFKPARIDLPALHDHNIYRVAGSTDKLAVEGKEIAAYGEFLKGTREEEPYANMIKSRLAQNFPYQCSGYWEPKKIENVLVGVTAKVNGETVNGPVTIFREYDLGEASFVEMGWDSQTRAVAAGKPDGDVTVDVTTTGEKTMTTEAKPATGILAALKNVFGADKAIEFVTAHPERKEISEFSGELITFVQEIQGALKTAKETITAHATKITQLETDLAAAKARPAVITTSGDSPEGGQAPAGSLPEGEEKWKADFKASKALQGEYPSEAAYVAFKKNEHRVTIK